MFGVRGFIEYQEANWLINVHEVALQIGANVYTLSFLEPLHWAHTASCWSVSTVVMCKNIGVGRGGG